MFVISLSIVELLLTLWLGPDEILMVKECAAAVLELMLMAPFLLLDLLEILFNNVSIAIKYIDVFEENSGIEKSMGSRGVLLF